MCATVVEPGRIRGFHGRATRPFAHTRAEITLLAARSRLRNPGPCARARRRLRPFCGRDRTEGSLPVSASQLRHVKTAALSSSAKSTLSSTPTSAARVRVCGGYCVGLSSRVAVAGRAACPEGDCVRTPRLPGRVASSRPSHRAVSGADLDAFIADVAADKSRPCRCAPVNKPESTPFRAIDQVSRDFSIRDVGRTSSESRARPTSGRSRRALGRAPRAPS